MQKNGSLPDKVSLWKLRQCWAEEKRSSYTHTTWCVSVIILACHPLREKKNEKIYHSKIQGRSWHLQLPSLLSLSWEDIGSTACFQPAKYAATIAAYFYKKKKRNQLQWVVENANDKCCFAKHTFFTMYGTSLKYSDLSEWIEITYILT